MHTITTKVVRLEKISEITEFVNEAMKVTGGEVIIRRERYVVSGSSLMGLISIDTTKGITVEYPASATEFDKFLDKYIVE